MKILLTGGGTGGHFYPMIAVAQHIRKISEENKLLQPEIFFVSDQPYDEDLLFRNEITFKKLSTGKLRLYFSIQNFFDIFKTTNAVIKALFMMWSIYPDVVFTNGGYGAFPMLFAAKFFRIPVVVHVTDTVPGKVALWASKFAKKISIGFPETADYLDKSKTAYTGNPIRRGLATPLEQGAHEFLKLEKETPTILILGGSQGSQIINDIIVDILPNLLEKYQIIHQTGKNNFDEVISRANMLIQDSSYKKRYKPFKYLDFLALKMAVGASDLIISRAGGSISEIAAWGIPSIVIPINSSAGDHQRKNAYSYARTGSTIVVEENNLTPHLLEAEIVNLMNNEEKRKQMAEATKKFAKLDAGEKIAQGILNIALGHEK
ncbi:MAG: UDP-N-acetylglucosamine--N-acetylmuramyl-(pentapeptide) pyrophosphoryl-undecaprenol N-acetylglucosamine transferase [Candidatus Pacebacteria bacterium]|nr:UDP-N-acetylglucosamine--N-acetylmuramyl-(pentapeptide) pyrophosphoryl-undecaprenol N-acetylglucosamine transferase [Candidatus Paceibacterota bacterium]